MKEKVAGLVFVVISRVKSIYNVIIKPMSDERLVSVKSSTNFKLRFREDARLLELSKDTLSIYKC